MGILVAIEGIDGAGKTTQVELLGKALREAGEQVVISKEPTDGQWGQRIRASAQNGRMPLVDELEAFIEDRKEHVANIIGPALTTGQIVVLDRYFYSTIAYQGARGADVVELAKEMEALAPRPDVVILLDLAPRVALDRIAGSRGDTPNHFEKVGYLAKVRKIFQRLTESHTEMRRFDGHRSIKDIHRDIVEELVEGPFKQYRAKTYDCDCWYCSYKEVNTCRWFMLQGRLRTLARKTPSATHS